MRLLIYGFERYGNFPYNVTKRVVRRLAARRNLLTEILPVEFEKENFLALLRHRPDAVLGLGQCRRGRSLRLELRAANRMRDLGGNRARKIDPKGPRSVSSTLAIEPRRWLRPSRDAGEYVCNYSMYVLLRRLARRKRKVPFAFIHIPHRYPLRRAVAHIEEIIRRVRQTDAGTARRSGFDVARARNLRLHEPRARTRAAVTA